MNEIFRARVALVAPLVASGLLVSGCMSSPTYGTDKTASEQLVGDVTGIMSLAPKRGPQIDYKPRPELVKPASTAALPAPQESAVTASADSVWPESPEQRRARIRARATENQDNPNFRPDVINDIDVNTEPKQAALRQDPDDERLARSRGGTNTAAQSAEFKRRLAENNQGNPTNRKYLSEPPLDYRLPAETAAVNDVGEDELKKERRIKKAAQKEGTGGWRNLIPWL